MNLQKFSPWNWLRGEENRAGDRGASTSVLDPYARMHREMDRLFEGFLGRSWPAPANDLVLKPSIDIAESKKAYRISVEVPGVDEKDIELTVDGDTLLLSGEKRQESESEEDGFHRVERRYGSFRRVLALPADADASGISAKFAKGVLTIKVPRREGDGEQSRRIPIGG